MIETLNHSTWGIPLIAFSIVLWAVIFASVQAWIRRRRAEAELLNLCNGDREMLERLIAFEQDRTPGQSREKAATAASCAIRRDNR